MSRRRALPLLVIAPALLAGVGLASGHARDGAGAAGAGPLSPSEFRRVSSLDPDRPRSYLLVGEWLARSDDTRALARETLATGALIAIDAARAGPSGDAARVAGSLIVALASLEPDPDANRGLWMLALSVDPDRAESFRWLGGRTWSQDSDRTASARALGLLRRGDPDALGELTDAHRARILSEARSLGLDADRIDAIIRAWRHNTEHDPCQGRLFVRTREGDRIVATPCPRPEFHHGGTYSDDWAAMVAIELSLAGHTPSSWPIRGAIGLDRPVPMWTPDRLTQVYGVSASRPVYRAGRWAEP